MKKSWVYKELYESRNFKGSFKNLYTGLIYGAVQGFLTKVFLFLIINKGKWTIQSTHQ